MDLVAISILLKHCKSLRYFSFSMLCKFTLLLHYMSEENIVLILLVTFQITVFHTHPVEKPSFGCLWHKLSLKIVLKNALI